MALLLAVTVRIAAISSADAQDHPPIQCRLDALATDQKLAEVATAQAAAAYLGCSSGKNCLPVTLPPGDPILGSTDIRPIGFDAQPPLSAWAGTWTGGEDRVTIRLSNTPGQLELKGAASWHSANDVVHLGSFAGAAAPAGNRLHFFDGSTESCASDNSKCGGMNVRFGGIWKRTEH